MANQALINAAQRMYSAKAAESQKDITPILKGLDSATDRILKAVEEKREDQANRSQAQTENFKDLLLKNPKLRPELSSKLQSLQDEYFKNLMKSENILVGKQKRAEAAEANALIADQLKKYESQLRSVDLNRSLNTSVSKSNLLGKQVDDAIFKDKTIVDNVVLKDDGFYFVNHEGKEVPLDEYENLNQVNNEGINNLIKEFSKAEDYGYKGRQYTGGIEQEVDALINSELQAGKNYMSLFFDDIGNFNYAKENLQQEIMRGRISKDKTENEQLEELKKLMQEDPDYYRRDFKNDYVNAIKSAHAAAIGSYNAEKIAKDNEKQGPQFSADRLNDFNRFIQSYNNAAGSEANLINMPDGGYAKYIGDGNYQLLNKNQSPIEGETGVVTDQELINIAGLPPGFEDSLGERYTGPLARDEYDYRTEEEKEQERENLLNPNL